MWLCPLPGLGVGGQHPEQLSECLLEGKANYLLMTPITRCVWALVASILTFHSPSSGWVSCGGEPPWELRVFEGSTYRSS